jgi:hypothetical protein
MSPRRWEDREAEFERRPWWMSLKVGLGIIALGAVLIVVGAIVSGALDWGGEGKRITGPDNTREQYTEIIRDKADMDAAMGNICTVRRSLAKGDVSGDAPVLVESPELAYEGTYRRAKADYDRRMENAFEGGLIKKYTSLGDEDRFPHPAPTLEDRVAEECPDAGAAD